MSLLWQVKLAFELQFDELALSLSSNRHHNFRRLTQASLESRNSWQEEDLMDLSAKSYHELAAEISRHTVPGLRKRSETMDLYCIIKDAHTHAPIYLYCFHLFFIYPIYIYIPYASCDASKLVLNEKTIVNLVWNKYEV